LIGLSFTGGNRDAHNKLDNDFYTKGSYGAYLGTFNVGGLTYTNSGKVFDSTFPDGTSLDWNYSGSTDLIKSFLQLASFGNYFDTTPQTPITPKRLSAIGSLVAALDMTATGSANSHNIIHDGFFTTASGNHGTQVYEYEVFRRCPQFAQDYINAVYVTQIGTPTIGGRQWQFAIDNTAMGGTRPDLLIAPVGYGDLLTASIDLKPLFDYAVAQSVIAGDPFFNGDSLGVEVSKGSGVAKVNSYRMTYT
jgi:hypothetical protein